jgi:NAD(P)-dependent dehydrogenase (short-subunit alcohol dehydrogenase family)
MDLQLKGKRALVTGASSGIGEAIAKALGREGASVVVHGRRSVEAQRVAAEIVKGGSQAKVVLGDLTDDAQGSRIVKEAQEAFGGIDILVNNAGTYAMLPWLETNPSKWAQMFNEDVISMVRMVQGVVPGMKSRKWGRVIQLSSGVATYPFPMGPDYSAAKAAVINLTVSLSKDLAGTGITANAVSPGPIVTEGLKTFINGIAKAQNWTGDWDAIEARAAKEVMPNPTGRLGRPEEIAAVVSFLSSPLAGFVTGANWRVDGGMGGVIN